MDVLIRILISVVILIHFAFLCFVILGAFLVVRWPRLIWFHVPAVVWGLLIEFAGVICPLTPLEKWLRSLAGQSVYAGGFINNYIISLIYPEGLTREAQMLLGVMLIAVNVIAYTWVYQRRRRATQ